jgi:Caspase domain
MWKASYKRIIFFFRLESGVGVNSPAQNLDKTKVPDIVDCMIKTILTIESVLKLNLSFEGDHYAMTHLHRGIALIFNHENFDSLPPRPGTTKDCTDIERVWSMLGFDPHVCNDFTCKDVKAKLEQSKCKKLRSLKSYTKA